MLFLGDLACPESRVDAFVRCVKNMDIFDGEIVVLNLEGCFVDDHEKRQGNTLYNVSKVITAFCRAEKVIVSLANNHMYDYPENILATRDYLEDHGVGTFGLSGNGEFVPYEYESKRGVRYAFFGHCWRVYTATNPNNANNVRLLDCKYNEFVQKVSEYTSKHNEVSTYCMMHWNYDLETLPFPLHRNIARKIIDAGSMGVIGCHSHLPQGAELYKGRPIAYCLGNFYLPSGVFFDGKLVYPDSCKCTYGVSISDTCSSRVEFNWFDTDVRENGNVIERVNAESFDGKRITKYSVFRDMDDREYVTYFSKHRVKNVLVPVFGKYSSQWALTAQEVFAIARIRGIKMIQGFLGSDK